MPPNLGGFFMVRSYYPSECHADYFDFERIEALKPAIEACGISTLSQSPMLGFHKQMDNRIKLLEEILSFRMQGVEFDNGDMYVDGHKAASDVRDEFVSVTEKLMDELAQCYNVLPQLDINNTIDHRPEGDEKWFLENEKTVTQFCRKLAAERPLKDIRDFERIEALKPAIEACGISTLSQSPMLGFDKQMDNRIKLLEEILSFRMQGVEFDNGDMYVYVHKAASDVRYEFVSFTALLLSELAQCYNVLPQLDINNTIDHRPEGDEKWFLE